MPKDTDAVIQALVDQLSIERIEVDVIQFEGPDFEQVDKRLISLRLVERGLTNAAMFTPDGEIVQPAEQLYKKPVLIERGSFLSAHQGDGGHDPATPRPSSWQEPAVAGTDVPGRRWESARKP
jgi:hypothetical protein